MSGNLPPGVTDRDIDNAAPEGHVCQALGKLCPWPEDCDKAQDCLWVHYEEEDEPNAHVAEPFRSILNGFYHGRPEPRHEFEDLCPPASEDNQ